MYHCIFDRYEDLFNENCRIEVIRAALKTCGLTEELGLTAEDIERARPFKPTRTLETVLWRYSDDNKSQCIPTEAEIRAALASPFVKKFGYKPILEAWLDSEPGDTTRPSLGPISQDGSPCFVFWGSQQ